MLVYRLVQFLVTLFFLNSLLQLGSDDNLFWEKIHQAQKVAPVSIKQTWKENRKSSIFKLLCYINKRWFYIYQHDSIISDFTVVAVSMSRKVDLLNYIQEALCIQGGQKPFLDHGNGKEGHCHPFTVPLCPAHTAFQVQQEVIKINNYGSSGWCVEASSSGSREGVGTSRGCDLAQVRGDDGGGSKTHSGDGANPMDQMWGIGTWWNQIWLQSTHLNTTKSLIAHRWWDVLYTKTGWKPFLYMARL